MTVIAEFSVKHHLEKAATVIDRFHVAQHYRDGFDALCKQETRRLKQELPIETYRDDFQGALWLLRHNYKDLNREEQLHLRRILAHSPQLHEAYTLRQELTAIFEMKLSQK